MDAARRAVAVLLAAGLLAGRASAQNDVGPRAPSQPIPYAELAHAAPSRKLHLARPKPRPAPPSAVPVRAPPPEGGAPGIRASTPPNTPSAPGGVPTPPRAPTPATPTPPAVAPPPIAAPSAGARLAPGVAAPAAELEAFVDAMMSRDLLAGRDVGAAVAVVQNGQVVLEKGYGVADRASGRAFDPARTGVRLGSASRLLTDLLVLKLADAGRLDLKAPADAALPAPLKLPAEGFARAPTLGEVLQARGGFETRTFGRAYRDVGALLPLNAALRRLRARRVRDPGGPAIESDYGPALAGAAAAHARGAEFETLAQTELFAPAGLASTSFREPRPALDGLPAPLSPTLTARLAQGYGWGPDGATPTPFRFAGSLAPALSASTTADDMGRLMLAELNGGRGSGGAPAWGPRVQAWLHAGPAAGEPLSGPTFGRLRMRLPGGFAGFGLSGAAPGFRVRYLVVPQLGLGVFAAANSDAAGAVDALGPALVARFYAAPARRAAASHAAADGLYLDARRAYHGLEGFVDRLGRLVAARSGHGSLVTRGLGRERAWSGEAGGTPLTSADGAELLTIGAPGAPVEALAEPGRAALAERVGWLHRPATLAGAAALAAIAAMLVLGGLCARLGREGARPTGQQTAATVTQVASALAWLAALAAFAVDVRVSAPAGDPLRPWPDPWLIGASSVAVLAAALTLVQVLQLPGVWAEGRRFSGWAVGRKLRHTLSVLVFAAFAAVLASWGALEPWSS